jgi:hypothetical protein
VIRYEPDQYGRMKQAEHGGWVTYAACQQAILEALEAECSPRRGYKQYEVGHMMLAGMDKQKDTSQEGQHGSR